MLQLKHVDQLPRDPRARERSTRIAALARAGLLGDDDARHLDRSYRFLRSIESGLRLMNTAARHDLPDDELELEKLAFLIGCGERRATGRGLPATSAAESRLLPPTLRRGFVCHVDVTRGTCTRSDIVEESARTAE